MILLVGLIAWLLTSRGKPEDSGIDVNIEVPAPPGTGNSGTSQ